MDVYERNGAMEKHGLSYHKLILKENGLRRTFAMIYRNRGIIQATLFNLLEEKGKEGYVEQDIDFFYGERNALGAVDAFRNTLRHYAKEKAAWRAMNDLRKIFSLEYVSQEMIDEEDQAMGLHDGSAISFLKVGRGDSFGLLEGLVRREIFASEDEGNGRKVLEFRRR